MAETNSVGLVEAMTLGTTKLVGRAVGFDKVTGKKISFSEDQVRSLPGQLYVYCTVCSTGKPHLFL